MKAGKVEERVVVVGAYMDTWADRSLDIPFPTPDHTNIPVGRLD